MSSTSIEQKSVEEIVLEHRGEEFVLVGTPQSYELMTADYLPVRYAYPASPKTGRAFSVGNIERQTRSEGFYGRKSEGWKAPQMKGEAQDTPAEAARQLLNWLDRKCDRNTKAAR